MSTTRILENNDENEPMLMAASNDHMDAYNHIIKRIIADKTADVNAVLTKDDETALILAARLGNPDYVRLLLARGAIRHAFCKRKYTPLMHAACTNHDKKSEIIHLLLPAPEDPKWTKAKKLLRITEATRSIAGDISTIFNKLSLVLATIHPILTILPWTSVITLGISSFYTALAEIGYNRGHIVSRTLVSLCALTILGTSIALFFIPTLLLPLAMASSTLRAAQYGVRCISSLLTELFGEGRRDRIALKNLRACLYEHAKADNAAEHAEALHALHIEITKLHNKQRARRREIAIQAHNVAQCLVGLTGTILLLFPATMPIGIAILATVAAYDILDTLGYNPLKILANSLFGNPFAPLKEYKTHDQFTAELLREKNNPRIAQPNSMLRSLGERLGMRRHPQPHRNVTSTQTTRVIPQPAFFDVMQRSQSTYAPVAETAQAAAVSCTQ